MKEIMKQILKKIGFEIRRLDRPEIRKGLNDTEKDFIEFFSNKRKRSGEETESVFLETRNRFAFEGFKYRNLCDALHILFKIQYGNSVEEELLDSYKFHELPHLFRMLSYSYNNNFKNTAEHLIRCIDKNPIICVDYGCGLGYVSYEIGRMRRDCKIYLVDIDNLILEFAKFRFDKLNINSEIILVSKGDIYPKLPTHNICIAHEVMEHLKQPLIAYQHICERLERGGILFGDFLDHESEMFHVTPSLHNLRQRLIKDFIKLNDNCYKKI